MSAGAVIEQDTPLGRLLRHWRGLRRCSQLDLAALAGVSARHISFVESGRSTPSREMVLRLAAALDVPLRERNELLLAAGYAPAFSEPSLDAAEMEQVRVALSSMLARQEPFPAVVLDRDWQVVAANTAAGRLLSLLGGGRPPAHTNLLLALFDPDALRPCVANWEELAPMLIQRVRREALGGPGDGRASALLERLLAYPDVPASWASPGQATARVPVLPVVFRAGGLEFAFFSLVSSFGTAADVTVQELRVECFFPADDRTRDLAHAHLATDTGAT